MLYRKKLGNPGDGVELVSSPANGRVLHIEVFSGAIYFHQRQPAQDTILNFGTNAVVITSVHVGMGQRTLFNDFVIMHHSVQPGRWLIISCRRSMLLIACTSALLIHSTETKLVNTLYQYR